MVGSLCCAGLQGVVTDIRCGPGQGIASKPVGQQHWGCLFTLTDECLSTRQALIGQCRALRSESRPRDLARRGSPRGTGPSESGVCGGCWARAGACQCPNLHEWGDVDWAAGGVLPALPRGPAVLGRPGGRPNSKGPKPGEARGAG